MQTITIYPDFLPEPVLAHCRHVAWHLRDQFTPTSIVPHRDDVRQSLFLQETQFPTLRDQVNAVLLPHLPRVIHNLGLPPMATCSIEYNLTRHGDGDFFKRHVDNINQRKVSFVCYFNLLGANLFDGGELKLYRGLCYQLKRLGAVRIYNPFPTTVQPVNNTIVFFKSSMTHEVTPVHCGTEWEAGRFTINGWVS